MSKDYSRREFVGDTARAALGAMIVPRHVLGGRGYQAPSATLNVAYVGIGGMGMQNMKRLLGENNGNSAINARMTSTGSSDRNALRPEPARSWWRPAVMTPSGSLGCTLTGPTPLKMKRCTRAPV